MKKLQTKAKTSAKPHTISLRAANSVQAKTVCVHRELWCCSSVFSASVKADVRLSPLFFLTLVLVSVLFLFFCLKLLSALKMIFSIRTTGVSIHLSLSLESLQLKATVWTRDSFFDHVGCNLDLVVPGRPWLSSLNVNRHGRLFQELKD
jgi:hypothetical protein